MIDSTGASLIVSLIMSFALKVVMDLMFSFDMELLRMVEPVKDCNLNLRCLWSSWDLIWWSL